jgi:hypothetical protein
MEMTFMTPLSPKFPFKGARSGNEVSDCLAQNFRSKNKAKPNLIQEIAKVTRNISIKLRNYQFYMKYGVIKSL